MGVDVTERDINSRLRFGSLSGSGVVTENDRPSFIRLDPSFD